MALICASGFFAFTSKSHPRNSLTITEFLNIQKMPPDILPEHSDPVVFDNLLFDGQYMQALSLLGEDIKTAQQNDKLGYLNSIESKSVKRESIGITKNPANENLQTIIVFYSFSLKSPQLEVPGRHWIGIRWDRSGLNWFPTQKVLNVHGL